MVNLDLQFLRSFFAFSPPSARLGRGPPNRSADAVLVLRFNAGLFPQSYLAPFFLGEALLAAGDTAGAIVAYRKSVENDEEMMDAIDRLKRLGAWPVR